MDQKSSGISLGAAVGIVLIAFAILVAAGIYVGDKVFWKPADQRTLADKKFDATKEVYFKNPKSKDAKLAYALVLYAKGDAKLAIKLMDELVKDYPKENAILVNAALVKNEFGQKAEAKKIYEKILSNFPYYVIANVQYGVILREEGNYENAIKKFDNALKIEPGAADVLLEKAKVYIDMKDNKKAKELINEALAFYPNYPEAKKLLKGLE